MDKPFANGGVVPDDPDARHTMEEAAWACSCFVISREELEHIERESGKPHQPFIDAMRKMRREGVPARSDVTAKVADRP